MSDSDKPRLLLGLTPIAERQIEEQLFGDEHAVYVVGSAADAAQLHALAERNDADASAWIARADRALYRAKQAGRNRCVDDELVPSAA